jgi:ribosome-binding factor A
MKERVEEALRETAAEFLNREASRQSLITVTRAEVSESGKRGAIYLSVFPVEHEAAALEFANRRRADFAAFFKKRIRAAMPRVEFYLDLGEKNRQRLDELTN